MDLKLRSDVEKFRATYLGKLQESRAKLLASGLKGGVQAVDDEVAACGNDADAFVEHFGGEPLP